MEMDTYTPRIWMIGIEASCDCTSTISALQYFDFHDQCIASYVKTQKWLEKQQNWNLLTSGQTQWTHQTLPEEFYKCLESSAIYRNKNPLEQRM